MALRDSGGVKSRAARSLGITERMLAYKMKTYGLGRVRAAARRP